MPCFRIAKILSGIAAKSDRGLFIGLIRKQAAAWRRRKMILSIWSFRDNSRLARLTRFILRLLRERYAPSLEQLLPHRASSVHRKKMAIAREGGREARTDFK